MFRHLLKSAGGAMQEVTLQLAGHQVHTHFAAFRVENSVLSGCTFFLEMLTSTSHLFSTMQDPE